MTDLKILIIGVLSAVMLSSCSAATNYRNSAANETEMPRASEKSDEGSMRDGAGDIIDEAGDVAEETGDAANDAADKVGEAVR